MLVKSALSVFCDGIENNSEYLFVVCTLYACVGGQSRNHPVPLIAVVSIDLHHLQKGHLTACYSYFFSYILLIVEAINIDQCSGDY